MNRYGTYQTHQMSCLQQASGDTNKPVTDGNGAVSLSLPDSERNPLS